jgi:hypothetical protein
MRIIEVELGQLTSSRSIDGSRSKSEMRLDAVGECCNGTLTDVEGYTS